MIKLYYSNSYCAILNISLEVRKKLLGLQRIAIYIYIYKLTSYTANSLVKKQLILGHETCNYIKYSFG